MEIYLILGLLFILLIFGIFYWIYRMFKQYKSGAKKTFLINLLIFIGLTTLMSWELRILPVSKTNDFKNTTESLTGKKFWSWNNYRYEEWGVRNEGYTLEIYNLNQNMSDYFKNPDKDFFEKFPTSNLATVKWQKTPVKTEDQELLLYVTPVYAGWKKEIIDKQNFIQELANKPGSYYAFKEGGTDFYLISPEKKLILWINHNM